MPKVKLTKTALKQERDSLKQFQRFLPTLQLKKQQLQLEMRHLYVCNGSHGPDQQPMALYTVYYHPST